MDGWWLSSMIMVNLCIFWCVVHQKRHYRGATLEFLQVRYLLSVSEVYSALAEGRHWESHRHTIKL